ncbi:MAG: hypothetical protein H3C30_13960 [Candidatus Hydrogenedentes bacterium]|nr:hypothetical protein [Candidatus Hydrogenedentota bacterium]
MKTRFAARAVEIVLGVYLVASALPKIADINRFSVQMSAYQVIPDRSMLPVFACVTVFTEIALGAALTLGLRLRGLTWLAYHGMLLFFSALIVYAWAYHGLEDCGCFPLVKMTPQVSLVKNVLMVAAGLFAGWALCLRKTPETGARAGTFTASALKLAVALMLAGAAAAYSWAHVEQVSTPGAADGAGPFAVFKISTEMGDFDLGAGEYLVPIMSMSCEECMAKVPELNRLAMEAGLLPMVGLCFEEKPGEMERFRNDTMPAFPLYSLGNRPLVYYGLRGDDPFRITLIRDGQALHFWDGRVPDAEEVMQALYPDEGDSGA